MPAGLTLMVFVQVPRVVSFLIFGALCVGALGPLAAAVYSFNMEIVKGEEVRVREFFSHIRPHYKKSVFVSAVMGIVLGVLVIDLLFFLRAGTGWMQFLSVMWVYIILFWVLTAQFVFPVVVTRNPSVFQTIKMAALMALDNLVASFTVALAGVLVLAISIFLRVPLMLFLMGTWSFLHLYAYDELIQRYTRNGETHSPLEGELIDD